MCVYRDRKRDRGREIKIVVKNNTTPCNCYNCNLIRKPRKVKKILIIDRSTIKKIYNTFTHPGDYRSFLCHSMLL